MSNVLSIDWRPSPNYVAVQRRVGDVRAIVLHSLEGSLESGLATFARSGAVSAHYVVGTHGELVQCVSEGDVAYHVAAWGGDPALNRNRPAWLPPYNGRYSAVNAATIGIELAGYAAQGFTLAQYTALGRLVASICQRWHLTPRCLPEWGASATVTTHGWLQSDRSDPGPHFDWAAFQAALDAAGGGPPAPQEGEDVARIAELEAQVADLTAQVVDRGSEAADLRDQVADLNGQNQTRQEQIDALRAQLAEANSTVGALRVDVIPPLQATIDALTAQAADAATVDGLRARVAELESRLWAIKLLVEVSG